MASVILPSVLLNYANGVARHQVTAGSVGAALRQLVEQFPELAPYLFDSADELRAYIGVYLNDVDIRTLDGKDTPLSQDEDCLTLIPAIAGG